MLKLEMQEGMKRPSFVWCNSEGGKGSRVSYFAAADALVRLGGICDPGSVKVSRDTLGVALEPVLSGLLVEAYMLGRNKSEAAEIDGDLAVKKSIDVITDAVKKDSDLAWAWHCNIAMSFQDEGGDRTVSNNAAARFMQLMFGVDTKKCEQWGFVDGPDVCNEAAPAPQEKLTEHQIRWVLTALSRLGSLAHLLNKLYIPVPKELAHINVTLQGMHKNQTSDGKPWVEPEPAIPDGWRRAEPDEWQRRDVKFCSSLSAFEWRLRPAQGIPFDKPIHNVRYIVPIDPPLTDHDACVWPRRLVMVRDIDRHPWVGPYKYLGKTDASYSIDPNNGGCATDWKQARPATPAEIEAASNKSC